MGTFFAVLGSFVLGAVVDHFLEARSVRAITKALKDLETAIVIEIRKLR